MASEFIQSKGIEIYNASIYKSRLEESLQAGTWVVTTFCLQWLVQMKRLKKK